MIERGGPRFYMQSYPTDDTTKVIRIIDRLEDTAVSWRNSNAYGEVYEVLKAHALCKVLNRYELSYCALRATGHNHEAAAQILLKQHQEDNPDGAV